MDFGNMLGDAFTYTKEGVLGNMNRWLKLILAILCLGLPFNGYIMRVYRGRRRHLTWTSGERSLSTG